MSKASERVKAWRKANPEKYRAQRRAQLTKSEAAREKERLRNRNYKRTERARELRKASRIKNRLRENALSAAAKKRRHRADPRRGLLNAARKRAAEKGLEFSLTVQDVYVPTHCPLLGIPLLVNEKVLGPNSPTLDRVFNSRGYTAENVLVVSYAANRCKGDLCADDIMRLAVNLKVLEAFRAPR